MNGRRDEIRGRLTDALGVLGQLGIEVRKSSRSGGGYLVTCPFHDDRTPSFSIGVRDGALVWKCHGACGVGGDVFDLVARVHGLDTSRDFVRVIEIAAGLANVAPTYVAPRTERDPRDYPKSMDVVDLWMASTLTSDDPYVAAGLEGRAIEPGYVDLYDLARVIPKTGALPKWATYKGETWRQSGHHLILPLYDARGALRSLKAWRFGPPSSHPKRLPPAGHKLGGLVLADGMARAMLRDGTSTGRLVVVEGEPDFLTRATSVSDADEEPWSVIGIASGAWTAAIAKRVPNGTRVAIRVDHDAAGEKYASTIAESLRERCAVVRSRAA